MNTSSNKTGTPSPQAQLKAWSKTEYKKERFVALLSLLDLLGIVALAWGLSHLVSNLWGHDRSLRSIALPIIVTLAAVAGRSGLGFLIQKLSLYRARMLVSAIRLNIMAKSLSGRIPDAPSLNSLFEETEALEGYFARFELAKFMAALAPALLIILVTIESRVSGFLLAVTLIPFIAMMAILGMTSGAESKRQLNALSRLANLLLDRLSSLPLILAFQDGPRQVRVVAAAAADVADRTLRVLKIAFLTSAVLEFFSALSVALVAIYCGFYLLGELPFKVPEHLTLATAFFVLALSPEVYAPMRRLSAAYHDRQTALASTERLMSIDVRETLAPEPPLAHPPEIEFRNVSCTFADDPEFRIGPVDFVAHPGTITSLNGPTGSGKTTLLRLMLDPTAKATGSIRINGEDKGDLSASVSWVSQNPPILAGTIYDNLMLANRDASHKDINGAVEMAGLQAFVASRPGGLNHVLNDRGSGLSGGERKRIGLARAILKGGPIWILDEPTADLDEASERDLMETLPKLFEGRTVILSTHSPKLRALASQEVNLA